MLSELMNHGHSMRPLAPPNTGLGLFCMAGGAGYELRVNEIYSWDGLKRGNTPFVLIQHTINGEGRLDYASVQHVLRPGDTMLLTFPHANRYWLAHGKHWEYFWMILNGREALRLAGAILSSHGPVIRPTMAGVHQLAGACNALLSGKAARPGAISSAAYNAIASLYDEVFDAPAEINEHPVTVRRALSFMEDNLAHPIDVGMIARSAGLSRAHFVRIFTEAVGKSPSAYLFERRMERATRLLLATDTPIKSVASKCGFQDANYFSKAFRRTQGCSPGRFRASRRGTLLDGVGDGRAELINLR